MVDEERLESFMKEVFIIQKPVHWFAEQINMDWFLYDRNLCHERVNALLLACVQGDILFDYIILYYPIIKEGCFYLDHVKPI